jgi:hypothetical protein
MTRALLPIACCLMPLVAFADAQIQMVGRDGKVDGTYQIKGTKVLMESVDSGDNSLVYDAATHGITVIDHARKRYMHLDSQTVAGAGAAVSGAMAELEKQLENLPPEQREAMKQYMPAMPGTTAASLPDIKATRTGRSDVVNGTACDIVDVTMDGKGAGEACIASNGTGLSEVDQQTLRTMFEDMSKMASSVLGGADRSQEFAALGGVPLRWREADSGRVTETRIDTKATIDASKFEVPTGYSQQKIEIPRLE